MTTIKWSNPVGFGKTNSLCKKHYKQRHKEDGNGKVYSFRLKKNCHEIHVPAQCSCRLLAKRPMHKSPLGLSSRGGDVMVYAFDINCEIAHSFFLNSGLVFISVSMTLSTVFHSINTPDNSPFSHSVLPVLSLSYWSFQLYL